MSKRILFTTALAGLLGLVAVAGLTTRSDDSPSVAIADIYLRCSAYYQTTADLLAGDGDDEVAEQYRERAALALRFETDLSGQAGLAMTQARNAMSSSMREQNTSTGNILGELASLYDDECLALIDED